VSVDTDTSPSPRQETPKRGGKPGYILRVVLLPLVIGILISCAILLVPPAGWTTSDITTGNAPGYPDLQVRQYDSSPSNTIQVVAASASLQPNWKVKGTDTARGTVQIEAHPALPIFTEDMTVTVTPTGPDNDYSQVTIRSHSRFGVGDLGANARNIRALQTTMDDKLPRLSP